MINLLKDIFQIFDWIITSMLVQYLCMIGLAYYYYHVSSSKLSKAFLIAVLLLTIVQAMSIAVITLAWGGKSMVILSFIYRMIQLYCVYLFFKLYKVAIKGNHFGNVH